MFIKVSVRPSEPVIYQLDPQDITIGAAATNHLILKQEFISKKHLRLVSEDNKWYAVDLGSTNGSFISEEQLIPGKRIEVFSGSIIKLADSVEIMLMDMAKDSLPLPGPLVTHYRADEHSSQPQIADEDKTRVISLDDIRKAKLLLDRKKRKDQLDLEAKELKQKKEEWKRITRIFFISFFVLILGFFASKIWKINFFVFEKQLSSKNAGDEEMEKDMLGNRIRPKRLWARSKIMTFFQKPRCSQDEVSGFCLGSTVFRESLNSAFFEKPSQYLFLINKSPWTPKASAIFENPQEVSENQVILISVFLILNEILVEELPDDAEIFIGLYSTDSQTPVLNHVWAANFLSIRAMLEVFNEQKFVGSNEKIEEFLDTMKIYFNLY